MQEVTENVTPLFVMLGLPLLIVGVLALAIRFGGKRRPRNDQGKA